MPLFRALAKNIAPMTNADESPTNRLTLFPIYLSLFVVSTPCQGSILGALFYLLYINDLPRCLNHSAHKLFADDTNLTVAGDRIQEIESSMNSDLAHVNPGALSFTFYT